MSDDDLDDLIEAWKRGEVELVEPDPVTRARLMDALDAADHTKEINGGCGA